MFFHKGNHGLSGAGPGYIYVILSNLNAQAAGTAGPGPGATGPGSGGPGLAGVAPAQAARARGGGSLLAGGEASVIDPAGPSESDSDLDRDNESDSPAGQGWPGGSDPENRD